MYIDGNVPMVVMLFYLNKILNFFHELEGLDLYLAANRTMKCALVLCSSLFSRFPQRSFLLTLTLAIGR